MAHGFASKCLRAGYSPKNGEAATLPIYQSTTFVYDKTKDVASLFDLKSEGFFYSRLSNPTVDCVEKKIAALEGGVGAMLTSSGQAATFATIMTLCKANSHVLSLSTVYGGTYNLFAVTLKRFGIEVEFIKEDETDSMIQAKIRDNTCAIFAETIANPAMNVLDIERFARIAHFNNIPLIVDNTFATPYLCTPFAFGADIVIHSTTKYLDGHATVVGGCVVDSGKFNFKDNERFSDFNEKDLSYHGIIYTEDFKDCPFIVKAKVQIMRDIGLCMSAQDAFLLDKGIETLPLRVQKHCDNARTVALYLKTKSKYIKEIYSPYLENTKAHELSLKYLKGEGSGVISFVLKGGLDAGIKFIDALSFINLEVHVADIRTCILHPASSTHRQLTSEQLKDCGIDEGLLRLSLGLDDVDDVINDLEQAFSALDK